MALTFGSSTTNKVDCGSAASLDNLPSAGTMTVCGWMKPTTGATQGVVAKANSTGANNGWRIIQSNTNRLQMVVEALSGGETNYQSATNSVTAVWTFFAAAFNSANGANEKINLYLGTRAALATEVSYGSRSDGASVSADATYSLEIGNLTTAGSFSYRGSIAWVGIWNTELTLAQIQALQFRRRVTSGCVGFWELGYNGTGTVPDWSGNANAGTNTSGTVTDHVPLPYRRGRGLWLPPTVTAAAVYQRLYRTNQSVNRASTY
jgi:hypothetical protein